MIVNLNPVLIAGFDILFLGKKGFSSLSRATKVYVRTKGSSEPWTILEFTKKQRLKADKENAIFRLLKKLSYARDLKKKKKKPKKALKKKKKKKPVAPKRLPSREEVEEIIEERLPEIKSDIKFNKPTVTEKAITTRQGEQIYIKKYDFTLKQEINFANGGEYEAPAANEFIMAVKKEFQKIFDKYGKTKYLVRLHHDYTNFVDYYDAFPKEKPAPRYDAHGKEIELKDKGFGGFSLNRQEFPNQKHLNMQFNSILPSLYLFAMSRYLNFANPSTEFNFSGFMIEVTIKIVKKKPRKK